MEICQQGQSKATTDKPQMEKFDLRKMVRLRRNRCANQEKSIQKILRIMESQQMAKRFDFQMASNMIAAVVCAFQRKSAAQFGILIVRPGLNGKRATDWTKVNFMMGMDLPREIN